MKFTYLLVDFFTILFPFLFSFHSKIEFYKTWRAFFPAVFLTGVLFIVWDSWFTAKGVWGFNEQYTIGTKIGNLPVEEVLFFFCIPYACVFTFYCINKFIRWRFTKSWEDGITASLIMISGITGIANYQKLYPTFTFISLAILLIMIRYLLQIKWLGKFYIVYTLLLFPFLLVNGILTGTGLENPVVWYNESEIIGIRIATIPVEDIFYGIELILMNLLIYHYLLERFVLQQTKE